MTMFQAGQDDDKPKPIFQVTTSAQFREALSRLRSLEQAPSNSSLGKERIALELAISRYLAKRERPAAS